GPRARQARSMTENITDNHAVRRLERSASDRMLTGVCGGLGRYFDLNPTFFRVGFVVLTLLGGAGVLVYLAAAFVMPDEGKERSLAEQVLAERKERPWPLIGLAVAGVALLVLLSRATLWPTAGAGWILVLVVGLVVLWVSRSARWGGRLLRVFVALVVAALAAFVAAIVLAFSWFNVSLGDGVGDHAYAPAAAGSTRGSVSARSMSCGPVEWMSTPLFERSSDDRVIAGVCGGIAARLAVDATLVRLVFAILALAGGAGVLVYFALWIYARRR